jgi:hypothetical protein
VNAPAGRKQVAADSWPQPKPREGLQPTTTTSDTWFKLEFFIRSRKTARLFVIKVVRSRAVHSFKMRFYVSAPKFFIFRQQCHLDKCDIQQFHLESTTGTLYTARLVALVPTLEQKLQ